MSTKAATRSDAGYGADFYAWTQDQAAKLRARPHNEVDWENLAEEIESVGRSDRRGIRSSLQAVSLADFPREALEASYAAALREVLIETRIARSALPETCPYTIDDVLDPSYPSDLYQGLPE